MRTPNYRICNTTLPELKKIAKQAGLSTIGTKIQLVVRIAEFCHKNQNFKWNTVVMNESAYACYYAEVNRLA